MKSGKTYSLKQFKGKIAENVLIVLENLNYQCIECQAVIYSKTGKFILNDEDESQFEFAAKRFNSTFSNLLL